MADARAPRSTETREKETRRKPWAPPSRLDAPEAPAGYVHRWIRTAMRGEDDRQMFMLNFVKDGNPFALKSILDYEAPTIEDGKFAGVIGNGGLMLCRIPIETANERNEYYGTRTREAMAAVDQDLMKEQNPLMPIHQSRQSRVTFGRGKPSSE